MIKEQIQTSLGSMAVAISQSSNPKGTLAFWPGMFFDGTMWDPVLDAFLTDYNILVIDPPGHGGSDAPQKIFSIKDCSVILREILDHHALPSCMIVGLSWGGFVAQSFCKHFPDRCDGLVLMNTCASGPKRSEKIMFTIIPRLLARFGVKNFESALTNALLSKSAAKGNRMLVSKLRNYLHLLDYKALKPVLFSVMKHREDLSDCLNGSDIPCLVIYGDQDPAMDAVRSEHLISRMPANVSITKLPVGHNAVLEAPSDVTAAMKRFLLA
ncbi:alpha/beta fold hydrolase [Leisingera sp. M658]|uniref:alpha/beta fold hydrolase n=1 Tax=Leisingera sp. M658 TaxID=2867015 RepID=UPI0021A7DE53|nr:alpha/beta hydrolase [Leisingera sp. M658]UWQ75684.1 alpha/beta hydrolase [Leisingera sp. M658]